MAQKLKILDIIGERETHRYILMVGMAMLLVLELIIYAVAVGHSGPQTWVEIYNSKNEKVYEAQGNLTRYERTVFEATYGPLEEYRIQTRTRNVPFPFRAWLAVAAGVPIGLVLLSIYLVRTYLSFVNEEEDEVSEDATFPGDQNGGFAKLSTWKRLSFTHVGILVLVIVLSFWLIPNYVADFARGFLSLVIRFKWFFLGVTVFFGSILVWIIYLKYKLSQKMMDQRVEVEKFRVVKQLQLEQESTPAYPEAAPRLEAPREDGDAVEIEPGHEGKLSSE